MADYATTRQHRTVIGRALMAAACALLVGLTATEGTASAAAFNTGPGRSWSIRAEGPGGGSITPGGPMTVIVTLQWDARMYTYPSCSGGALGSTSDLRQPTMYFLSPGASPTSFLFSPCGPELGLSADFYTATWTTTITAPASLADFSVTAYSRGTPFWNDSYNFSYSSPFTYSTTTTTTTTTEPPTTTTTEPPTTTTTEPPTTTTTEPPTTTTEPPTTTTEPPTTTTTEPPTTTTTEPPTTTTEPPTTTTTTPEPATTSTPTTLAPTGSVSLGIQPGERAAGRHVHVVGSGLEPGAPWTINLHSTPTTLATGYVADDGTVDVTVPLPDAIEPGQHSVILEVAGSAPLTRSASFELDENGVVTSALPSTGSQHEGLLLLAAACFFAGLALEIGSRRRQPIA